MLFFENMLPIQAALRLNGNHEKAKALSRFFKTGKGEYGEGDQFLGLTVPEIRKAAKLYKNQTSLEDVDILLASPYHEDRFSGVVLLTHFVKEKKYPLEHIAKFYIDHIDRINNWDLVDTSAEYIIGPYLLILNEKSRQKFITSCLESDHLWTIRIIILASFSEIKAGREAMTLSILTRILGKIHIDPQSLFNHDLIQKACGWMLREVGKRVSREKLIDFLDNHASTMPRTMLRYAIEHLSLEERKEYLKKKELL